MSRLGILATIVFWIVSGIMLRAADTAVSTDLKLDGAVRTPDRQAQAPVRSWLAIRNQYIVMQQKDYSCGAATLATVFRYFWGVDVSEEDFLEVIEKRLTQAEMADRVKNGLSMTDLRRAAVDTGQLAVMGRRTLDQLADVKVPLIIRITHDGHEHFVVFKGVVDGFAYLADPIRGNLRVPLKQFAREWTDGVVLVVARRGGKPPEIHPLLPIPPSIENPELQSVRRVLSGAR